MLAHGLQLLFKNLIAPKANTKVITGCFGHFREIDRRWQQQYATVLNQRPAERLAITGPDVFRESHTTAHWARPVYQSGEICDEALEQDQILTEKGVVTGKYFIAGF